MIDKIWRDLLSGDSWRTYPGLSSGGQTWTTAPESRATSILELQHLQILALDLVCLVGAINRPENSPGVSRSALPLDDFIIEDNRPGVRPASYAQHLTYMSSLTSSTDNFPELGKARTCPLNDLRGEYRDWIIDVLGEFRIHGATLLVMILLCKPRAPAIINGDDAVV